MTDIVVGLAIQAKFQEARAALQQLRSDLAQAMTAVKGASQTQQAQASSSTQAAAAQRAQSEAAQTTAASMRTLNTAVAEATRQNQALAASSQAAATSQRNANAVVAAGGISAKQTAAAMRMLPAQITDITTSVASGMPIWLVAIQQGGQIKDSFGGVGATFRALATLITPVRVGLAGLAVAGLAVVKMLADAERDTQQYNLAVQTTGNYAGATRSQVESLAAATAEASELSLAAARSMVSGMVQTGQIGMGTIENLTKSVKTYAAVTGQSTDAAGSSLAKLFVDPARAAEQLDKQFNFLTLEQQKYLRQLVEQGRGEDARLLVSKAFADHMGGAFAQNLGTLQRAWDSLAQAAGKAWNAIWDVGRKKTPAELVAEQQQVVDTLAAQIKQREESGLALGRLQAQLAAANAQLTERQAAAEQESAKAAEESREAQRKREKKDLETWFKSYTDSMKTGAEKLTEEKAKLKQALDFGSITQSEYDEALKRATERAARSGTNIGLEAAKATQQVRAAQSEASLRLLQASIKSGDAIIVQAVTEGNVSIQAAYDARLSQMQTETEEQRKFLDQQLAAVTAAIAQARTPGERAPLQQRKIQIIADRQLLDASLADATRTLDNWKRDTEQRLSTISANIRVQVADLTGVFDRGAVERQLLDRFRDDYRLAGASSDPAQAKADRERIDMLVQAGVAQAEFNAKLAEAQRIQRDLAAQEASVNAEVQSGQISQLEGEARIRTARQAQIPALEAILAKLRELRGALPQDAAKALDDANAAIVELGNQVKTTTPVIVDAGAMVKNNLIDGFSSAAGNAVANWENAGQAIKNVFTRLAGDIVSSGVREAIIRAFSVDVGGGSGGGFWSSLFSAVGGALFGGGGTSVPSTPTVAPAVGNSVMFAADGGHIRGPGTETSDSIPAMLSDNEFVQPARAVRHYGRQFMESIRALRFPRPKFAFGGLVQASRSIARFADGGAASQGSQAALVMPNVIINTIYQGTPQRVTKRSEELQGRDLVVSLILEDFERGGPISQAMPSVFNRGGA